MTPSNVAIPSPSPTRGKLLEAAETLFADRGFAGVGMQRVAAHVGIGKSSLFHHFATKLELYEEVLTAAVGRIQQRLEPALASAGDPVEKLDRLVDALVDALAEHPTTARLLLRTLVEDAPLSEPAPEAEPTAYERVVAQLIEHVHGLLREGAARGVFRPVPLGETTQHLIGVVVYHFASGDFGAEVVGQPIFSAEAVARFKREVKRLFHCGLAAAPPV